MKNKPIFSDGGVAVNRLPEGGYVLYAKTDMGLQRCPLPAWVTAEAILAIGADMRPAPKPVRKAAKKKPVVADASGE